MLADSGFMTGPVFMERHAALVFQWSHMVVVRGRGWHYNEWWVTGGACMFSRATFVGRLVVESSLRWVHAGVCRQQGSQRADSQPQPHADVRRVHGGFGKVRAVK